MKYTVIPWRKMENETPFPRETLCRKTDRFHGKHFAGKLTVSTGNTLAKLNPKLQKTQDSQCARLKFASLCDHSHPHSHAIFPRQSTSSEFQSSHIDYRPQEPNLFSSKLKYHPIRKEQTKKNNIHAASYPPRKENYPTGNQSPIVETRSHPHRIFISHENPIPESMEV